MRQSTARRMTKHAMAIAVVCTLPMLTACEWFSDFKRTPMLATWEPIHCDASLDVCDSTIASRGNPKFSVPVYGTVRSALETSHDPFPGVIESMSSIANPTPITDSSLQNGHKYYEINCTVCHGAKGMGDGPAIKFGIPGIALTAGPALDRTDGYIYGMIRNGRGAMPSYNRIEELDRWDVVNYIRMLQGRTELKVATGALAAPGVTGRWVPGATNTAPQKQAPFVAPSKGSAKAYYPPGGGPPAKDDAAVPVGPKLIDSMLYKSGTVEGKQK